MRVFIDANIILDDFEDALQLECAKEFNADYIITRDRDAFKDAEIEILSPKEFIKQFI